MEPCRVVLQLGIVRRKEKGDVLRRMVCDEGSECAVSMQRAAAVVNAGDHPGMIAFRRVIEGKIGYDAGKDPVCSLIEKPVDKQAAVEKACILRHIIDEGDIRLDPAVVLGG